jgi:hypothetical protein
MEWLSPSTLKQRKMGHHLTEPTIRFVGIRVLRQCFCITTSSRANSRTCRSMVRLQSARGTLQRWDGVGVTGAGSEVVKRLRHPHLRMACSWSSHRQKRLLLHMFVAHAATVCRRRCHRHRREGAFDRFSPTGNHLQDSDPTGRA